MKIYIRTSHSRKTCSSCGAREEDLFTAGFYRHAKYRSIIAARQALCEACLTDFLATLRGPVELVDQTGGAYHPD